MSFPGPTDDWRAAAWFLERSEPEEAPKHKLEHSGPAGGPIRAEAADPIDYSKLSAEGPSTASCTSTCPSGGLLRPAGLETGAFELAAPESDALN